MKNKKAQYFGLPAGQAEPQILSNFILLILFLALAVSGGLIAGVLYYDMGVLDTALHTVNFQIPIQDNASIGAVNVTDFQGILKIIVYPILGLRTSLPYLTYFMIFAFIIAMAITAYLSSKNAIFFVLHLLFTILISYFCLLIANAYIGLMSQPFINSMMLPFPIYNKIMFVLPQVVFFTGLLFGSIAFINIIKPNSNKGVEGINYGGDY